MREQSETFMNDLLNPEGVLHPILSRGKKRSNIITSNLEGLY